MKNIYTREEYDALRRRSDAYAEANMEMQKRLESALKELDYLRGENARVKAEMVGMHNTMQIMLNDNNNRYQKQNDEVGRLRSLLKTHGIHIGE